MFKPSFPPFTQPTNGPPGPGDWRRPPRRALRQRRPSAGPSRWGSWSVSAWDPTHPGPGRWAKGSRTDKRYPGKIQIFLMFWWFLGWIKGGAISEIPGIFAFFFGMKHQGGGKKWRKRRKIRTHGICGCFEKLGNGMFFFGTLLERTFRSRQTTPGWMGTKKPRNYYLLSRSPMGMKIVVSENHPRIKQPFAQ